jgi:thioredoxin reductase (NADPH)
VSSCAACDGFLFRGKKCVVVGGGDTALEEALFLSNICANVLLVHRRDRFRAGRMLQQRVFQLAEGARPRISVLWNAEVAEFAGGGAPDAPASLMAVRVVPAGAVGTEEQGDLVQCDAAFVAIGHDPKTGLLSGQGVQFRERNPGYLQVQLPGTDLATQTNVAGLFAAGDVADPVYRQAGGWVAR